MDDHERGRRWRERVYGPAVARHAERRARFETTSGIELPPVAAPGASASGAHVDPQSPGVATPGLEAATPGLGAFEANLPASRDRKGAVPTETADDPLGFPGEFPFTRGIYPSMYRGRLWTMRQYSGFGTASETNRRYHYLLGQGQTGLSVAFDLPTQIGYDPDHPLARGEVGRAGVSIATLADMETLLSGIPLERVTVSMTINSTAATLLAMLLIVAEKQGVPWERVGGTIQNDMLKEYIARKTYIYPPRPSLRLITDVVAFCAARAPRFNPISISGYHMREAGCTAAQEIGFTLCNGIAYVEAAIAAGLDVDRFAGRLSFFFNGHSHFLEEVAKFRAARRLWAHIMRDRFGATDPKSWMLRFHTQVAGSTLTAQEPDNNVARVALQALAAVLGGTQSLHTNALDEALGLPTERSARIALRTQQIIAHETGVADTADPLGGSYLIESLTDELQARARAIVAHVDQLGGAVRAIEQGYFQREIQAAAYDYQRRVESGEQIVVGVNAFVDDDDPAAPPEVLKVDPKVQDEAIARLRAFKAERDDAAVAQAREALERAARGTDNLMPSIVDAVKAGCTTGEIADTFRTVWGEYTDPGL